MEENSEEEQFANLDSYLAHHNTYEASQYIHQDYRSHLHALDDDRYYVEIDRIYVVPQRSWGDRSDTDHSKCLLLGGRRLNLLTIIPKPKGSGGARAATAQIGPANERNKTK